MPPQHSRLAQVSDAAGNAIDEIGGEFAMPYTTVVVTAAKTP